MTRNVRVLGSARDDLIELRDWYNDQEPDLGISLVDRVGERFDFIAEFPYASQEAGLGVRRIKVHRFPVLVYYTVRTQSVDVVAILHERRSAREWKSRVE